MRYQTCIIKSYPVRFKPEHAWISPGGEVIPTSFTLHNKVAGDIIKGNGWLGQWKASNKNRGYDYKEFLIIVKGYLSINSGYCNYNSRGQISRAQIRVLGCDPSYEEFKMDCFFSDMC